MLYRDAMGRALFDAYAAETRMAFGPGMQEPHGRDPWPCGDAHRDGQHEPALRCARRACAETSFGALRLKSQQLYRGSWDHLEHHVGGHTAAHLCTRDTMVELRRKLEDPKREPKPLGVTTLQHMFSNLRVVFRWAEDAGKIPTSSVLRYVFRVAKGQASRPAGRVSHRGMGEDRGGVAVVAAQAGRVGDRWAGGATGGRATSPLGGSRLGGR